MKLRQLSRVSSRRLGAIALLGALSLTAACGQSVVVKPTGLASPSSSSSSSDSSSPSDSSSASASDSSSDSSSPSGSDSDSAGSGMTGKNAACTDAMQALEDFDSEAGNDSDLGSVKTDVEKTVTRLKSDAAKESDPAAKSAMLKIANDFSGALKEINDGKTPDVSNFESDGETLGESCF